MATPTSSTIIKANTSSPLLTPASDRDVHIPVIVTFLVAALVLVLAIHSLAGSRTYSPRVKHLLYITLACNLAFSLGYLFLGCANVEFARAWQAQLDQRPAMTPQEVDNSGLELNKLPVYVVLFTSAQSLVFGGFFASGFSEVAFLWIIRSNLVCGSTVPGHRAAAMTLGLCIVGFVLGCGGMFSFGTPCANPISVVKMSSWRGIMLCLAVWWLSSFPCWWQWRLQSGELAIISTK